MADQAEKPLLLGYISGVYGLKGWVKIFSHTLPRENILSYNPWLIQGRSISVESGRKHGKSVIAKLDGIDDCDQAASLVRADICIERECLPQADSDEYYWCDLIGLRVQNQQQVDLGQVDYLFETGANDVMVVKGERERLLPFLPEVVLHVNFEQGLISVDWDAEF